MTVRPGLWRPIIVIPWAMLAGLFIALGVSKLAVSQPGQAVVAFAGPVLLFLLAWVRARSVRLEIAESVVLARQGRWRGHPDREAPRSEIRAIHYFPRMISFRGPDNKPIMTIDGNYTLRQMMKVAVTLEVPLYDHARWLGMRKISIGRLLYDPASRHSVS
jgi:hypothetical protein